MSGCGRAWRVAVVLLTLLAALQGLSAGPAPTDAAPGVSTTSAPSELHQQQHHQQQHPERQQQQQEQHEQPHQQHHSLDENTVGQEVEPKEDSGSASWMHPGGHELFYTYSDIASHYPRSVRPKRSMPLDRLSILRYRQLLGADPPSPYDELEEGPVFGMDDDEEEDDEVEDDEDMNESWQGRPVAPLPRYVADGSLELQPYWSQQQKRWARAVSGEWGAFPVKKRFMASRKRAAANPLFEAVQARARAMWPAYRGAVY